MNKVSPVNQITPFNREAFGIWNLPHSCVQSSQQYGPHFKISYLDKHGDEKTFFFTSGYRLNETASNITITCLNDPIESKGINHLRQMGAHGFAACISENSLHPYTVGFLETLNNNWVHNLPLQEDKEIPLEFILCKWFEFQEQIEAFKDMDDFYNTEIPRSSYDLMPDANYNFEKAVYLLYMTDGIYSAFNKEPLVKDGFIALAHNRLQVKKIDSYKADFYELFRTSYSAYKDRFEALEKDEKLMEVLKAVKESYLIYTPWALHKMIFQNEKSPYFQTIKNHGVNHTIPLDKTIDYFRKEFLETPVISEYENCIASMKKYLKKHGWLDISTTPTTCLYKKEGCRAIIPLTRDLLDYEIVIHRAIKQITLVDEINEEDLIWELYEHMEDLAA